MTRRCIPAILRRGMPRLNVEILVTHVRENSRLHLMVNLKNRVREDVRAYPYLSPHFSFARRTSKNVRWVMRKRRTWCFDLRQAMQSPP